MKYVGIVIKKTWINGDDTSEKSYVEKSRPYDIIEEADNWIADKRKETDEMFEVISNVYSKGIIIEDSTIIAIDDEKSESNYNDILIRLVAGLK